MNPEMNVLNKSLVNDIFHTVESLNKPIIGTGRFDVSFQQGEINEKLSQMYKEHIKHLGQQNHGPSVAVAIYNRAKRGVDTEIINGISFTTPLQLTSPISESQDFFSALLPYNEYYNVEGGDFYRSTTTLNVQPPTLQVDTCDFDLCRLISNNNRHYIYGECPQQHEVPITGNDRPSQLPAAHVIGWQNDNAPSVGIYFKVVFFSKNNQLGSPTLVTEYVLLLKIRFGAKLAQHKNPVAIDFGNTNTSIAWYSEIDGQDPFNNIVVLTTPSATQFSRINSQNSSFRLDDEKGAEGQLSEWRKRVECPKRWIGAALNETLDIGDEKRINGLIPAQACVSRILAANHAKTKAFANFLALTYPTTYVNHELMQLKAVVESSIKIARGFPAAGNFPSPDLIDEASASAFYFWAKQFFNSYRAPLFRYIYGKKGEEPVARILIIDVGGGTTDVAFVECAMKSITGNTKVTMTFTPIFRTGLRDFGGDDITIAIFKVIKALIHSPTQSKEDFWKWFDENEVSIDKSFSTKWEKERESNPSLQRKVFLWHVSEFFKINATSLSNHIKSAKNPGKISGSPSTNFSASTQQADGDSDAQTNTESIPFLSSKENEKLLTELLSADGKKDQETLNKVKTAFERASDIIALVNEHILEKLEKCCDRVNNCLASHLRGNTLDHVYLVGGASQYPLIQELFVEKLKHLVLASDWQNGSFDTEFVVPKESSELKAAVVKGALLAKRFEAGMGDLKVEWPNDLLKKSTVELFTKMSASESKTIFLKIGDDLDNANKKWKRMFVLNAGLGTKQVTLSRRFDGDAEDPNDSNSYDYVRFNFEFEDANIGKDCEIYIAMELSSSHQEDDKYYLTYSANNTPPTESPGKGRHHIRGTILPRRGWAPPIRRGDL